MKSSNVNIENSNSIYNAQEKHEYERSGLTVSVGGDVIDAANTVIQPLERAHQVQDDRLSILYGVKAGTEANDIINDVNNQHKVIDGLESDLDNLNKTVTIGGTETDKAVNAAKDKVKNDLQNAKDSKYGGNNDFNINIGIGITKSKSESESTTIVANGSNVKAEGDVTITSTKKDINIKGSNVEGNDVKLNAKENLNITASENTNTTEQNSKSSSASIGATIGVGGLQGINAGYSKSQGNIKENGTTYNESTVTANKDMEFTSGKDTNIKGGKVSGDKVTGNVGGDLNIESKQDSNSYEEKNTSAGVNIDYNFGNHKIGVGGSAGTSNIDSNYNSVTEQSGIYAGSEGFDINVEKNTDLKGGIIDSKAEADKNKISTGTLTYEDIENKAEYEAGGMGVNVNINNGADYNEKGVTPNIGMPAGDEAESTTKATIAEGEIEIRDKENQKQDLAGLNRDTQNSLNKLGEIFDKDSIEERQELANLFGELAYNQVHYMKGTDEQKAMYHAVIGGIMSQLTNGDFLAGASATAVNKLVMDEIKKVAGYDPAAMQWLSAALGAVIGEVVSNDAQAGAGAASSATKNNDALEAELKAQNNATMKEVIDADKMRLFENQEEVILQQYGVDNIYKLSSVQQEEVIQKIASSMNISFDEAQYIHNTKEIVEGSIALGVGLGGFVHLSGITGKAVIDGHIEGSTADDVKLVGEVAFYLQTQGVFKVGGEYRYNYYPDSKIVRVETFVGLDTPYATIGINNIPDDYDCIIETGAGGYLFSGGEIKGKINMSEFYRKFIK